MKKILAIETSCDETAASVVNDDGQIKVLSNVVNSQIALHQETKGVIPEVAARAHIENILPVIEASLENSGASKDDIDAIAVTVGPGLIGSLLVGVNTAKTLSYVWKKPIYPINHLYGHLYASHIENEIELPAVIMTASGGHTMLVLMDPSFCHSREGGNLDGIKVLGQTLDDAAGEAFDKVAKMLGLGYPGGPEISKWAAKYKGKSDFAFPRSMLNSKDYNFSFSGIKTAVLYKIRKDYPDMQIDNDEYRTMIAYEFEEAVTDILVGKAIVAAKEFGVKTISISGGVAANRRLRSKLEEQVAKTFGDTVKACYPSLEYCTDNAAMIGVAALIRSKFTQPTPWQEVKADANLEIEN